ncbi:hypothetical protein [Oribacterium sp. P6A1]|uniref:hypothetical protein n=1 Tax=Oribacterium sp. P6A1 TaxID=1410612 RepID=UPI00056950AD|nr:hypothetical protein [Oribacterium sp. P6A1]
MEKLNGIDLVCIAVDNRTEEDFSGSIFTQYSEDAVRFDSSKDMLNKLDELYDEWGFPEASEKPRSFLFRRLNPEGGVQPENPKKRLVNMAKEVKSRDVSGDKGRLATFHVLTEMRQHSSWQGKALWVEKEEKIEFLSVLDLLFFIDDALKTS